MEKVILSNQKKVDEIKEKLQAQERTIKSERLANEAIDPANAVNTLYYLINAGFIINIEDDPLYKTNNKEIVNSKFANILASNLLLMRGISFNFKTKSYNINGELYVKRIKLNTDERVGMEAFTSGAKFALARLDTGEVLSYAEVLDLKLTLQKSFK